MELLIGRHLRQNERANARDLSDLFANASEPRERKREKYIYRHEIDLFPLVDFIDELAIY